MVNELTIGEEGGRGKCRRVWGKTPLFSPEPVFAIRWARQFFSTRFLGNLKIETVSILHTSADAAYLDDLQAQIPSPMILWGLISAVICSLYRVKSSNTERTTIKGVLLAPTRMSCTVNLFLKRWHSADVYQHVDHEIQGKATGAFTFLRPGPVSHVGRFMPSCRKGMKALRAHPGVYVLTLSRYPSNDVGKTRSFVWMMCHSENVGHCWPSSGLHYSHISILSCRTYGKVWGSVWFSPQHDNLTHKFQRAAFLSKSPPRTRWGSLNAFPESKLQFWRFWLSYSLW